MKNSDIAVSFGSLAKDYQKFRPSYDDRLYKTIFSKIQKPAKGEEIVLLDIGCGTGKSTEKLVGAQQKFPKNMVRVIGCDPDTGMLAQASKSAKKQKLPIAYLQATAEALPFEKQTFSAVITAAAFHWFGTVKNLRAIKKTMKPAAPFFVIWQLSARSGSAIGSDLYKQFKWEGIPGKFRDPEYVSELLVKAYFQNVAVVKIPFSEERTIAESVGLAATNSRFALLSKDEQVYFKKELTKAYKQALGDQKTIVEKKLLYVCYGFAS